MKHRVKFKWETYALLFLLYLFFNNHQIYAQKIIYGNTNSWFTLINRFDINDKWSISNELHERTGAFFHTQGQFLVRPSIDFHLNKEFELSLGYTFIRVNPYKPYNLPISRNENNIWEQFLIKNSIGRVKIQHRFRQEHRWVNHVEADEGYYDLRGNDYSNRFRYRFTVSIDVYTFKKTQHQLFVSGWDEIWITQSNNLTPRDFNRNWLYLGIGISFDSSTNVQLGYMHQYDKVGTNEFVSSPIFQITLQKKFSHKKTKK